MKSCLLRKKHQKSKKSMPQKMIAIKFVNEEQS
jgi:hypothetical protein